MVFAYTVPVLIAVLAVQTWFRGGGALAGGDLAPPVEPGIDYRSHWNQFEAGEGTPTFSIVAFPAYEGLRAFASLGLDAATFQRVWLTLLVAGGVAAIVFLASSIVRSPLACATAGLLSLFSAYHLATGFDPVPLGALLSAAVLGALVIRAGSPPSASPVVFAVASLSLAVVAANPAQVGLVLGWVAACVVLALAVHGRTALRRLVRFLAIGTPLALLLNLWWIVPFVQTVAGPVFTERFAAPGVDEWAWTHARASLENVIALTSNWGWTQPEYFPYSARLERRPLSVLQYLPAVAAAAGVLLAVTWRAYRWLGAALAALVVGAVWMMKGLHEPLEDTNRWAYEHVPGFWLYRDPAKVGLVLVLAFALLAALAVARVTFVDARAGAAVALLLVGGAAIYAHPVVTGAIVPDERPLLPSAHVRIPKEFEAAAHRLDDPSVPGKAVVLPQLDYYQAPTTWGYYGASFLHQLIRRPVIEVLPGGYYRNPPVAELVQGLESGASRGSRDLVPILRALGARYIVLRRDLDTDFPGRSFANPRTLSAGLRNNPELRMVASSNVIEVYEAPGIRWPELYAAAPIVARSGSAGSLIGLLGPDVRHATAVVPSSERAMLVPVPTGEATVAEPPSEADVAAVQLDGRRASVRFTEPGDAPRAAGSPVQLDTPLRPFRIVVGQSDSIVRSAHVQLLISIASKERRRLRPLTAIELPARLAREVGDCNRFDDRSLDEVGISARVLRDRPRPTLRLRASEHAACVAFPIPQSRPDRRVRVRFDYRGITGNPPRACIWQVGPDECAASEPIETSPGWHRQEVTFEPKPGTTSSHLYLYADGGADEPTVTQYRALATGSPPLPLAIAAVPKVSLPQVTYRRQTPYSFRARVRNARRPFVLVTTETFAPGWKVEASGLRTGDVPHFRVNGYANGWRIPWTGSYDLTIAYAPERPARVARLVDLAAVPIAVLLLVLWPRGFRRRRD
jgi:arabinofuranan 3-O-arabinosyltransferase